MSGDEVWCLDDYRPGRKVSGVQRLAQAAYHRITTPRGTLRDGPEGDRYGIDVCDYIGAMGHAAAVALPGIVSAELAKDSRFAIVDCNATHTQASNGEITISMAITVTPSDDEIASFTLRLQASATSVKFGGLS